ncbi:MAG: ABC transporter ATP-binding protein [Armatimonadota bacterium]|jgi:phospholipid/cholesterol/gamma-HCH transport system ATP-binding protein
MPARTTERDAVARVEIRDVSYAVDGVAILSDISLRVNAGEIFAVMGTSGCGKTTLLRNIIGLVRPTSGEVLVDGESIGGLSERELVRVRRKMGMSFQYSALFDSMSVGENVAFPLRRHARLSEDEIRSAVAEKLTTVGMEGRESMMPGELSGGERKRVGIARALALRPAIMLYDEPSSGLDPVMAGVVDDLIVCLRDELDVTSIVASHHVSNALGIADRVMMLHEGRMVAESSPESLRRSDDDFVRQFITGSANGPIAQ